MIRKRAKYGNKKIVTEDGEFASRVEYNRWLFLKDAQERGLIRNLRKQVEYVLLPVQYKTEIVQLKTKIKPVIKVAERAVTYIADYVYEKADGTLVVEDVKGFPDEKYPIKRKMMLYFHKIAIREVKKSTEDI